MNVSNGFSGLIASRPARRLAVLAGLACAVALPPASPARAQAFPSQPIRIVSAFPASTGGDAVVQHFAESLSRLAGTKVTVESRAGNFGNTATEYVRKAKPDGYTIHIAPASATLAAAPSLYRKVNFDPVQDFTPLAPLARLGVIFAVDAASPIKSLAELTAALKKKGDSATYGAVGNTAIVAAEMYKKAAGVDATLVPYRELLTATTDMAAGKIDFLLGDTVWAAQQAKAKKVRLLAISTATPMGIFPDVPAAPPQLGKDFDPVTTWWAAFAPAKTPPAIVAAYEKWFAEIAQSAETKKALANLGLDPFPGNAQALAALLAGDMRKWVEFVKLAKINPQ